MTTTPFFTHIQGRSSPQLQRTTLVVPAVSIGSVPQLAIDLLLHHPDLHLVKVGRIDPTFCFPFVGPCDSPHGDDGLTTALEVFSNGKLTVVQQRSPVYKSRSIDYITALTHWISSSNFAETLWLSSIDAAARTDDEFSTPILSLFPSNNPTPSTPLLSSLSAFPQFNTHSENTAKVPYIPGSLLTRKLLAHISTLSDAKLNLAALLYFAAEGDTRYDAHFLANLVLLLSSTTIPEHAELERCRRQSLAEPQSWSALFGRPPSSALYG